MRKIPIIEMFLSIVSIWWAIILFLSFGMLNNVPKQLKPFAKLGEMGWGYVFVATTLILILGVILNNRMLRKFGLLLCFFLYGMITAGFILSDPIRTATGTYFAICLLSIYGLREVGETNAGNGSFEGEGLSFRTGSSGFKE
jgi:hypothetical protein